MMLNTLEVKVSLFLQFPNVRYQVFIGLVLIMGRLGVRNKIKCH